VAPVLKGNITKRLQRLKITKEGDKKENTKTQIAEAYEIL
jgi:hypothetical protein